MKVKSIMAACGSGLGSSMLVRMNIEKVLKQNGHTGISVLHSSLSDVSERAADIIVVGKDLEEFVKSYKNVIVLDNIMSVSELEEKLLKKLNED